MKPNPLEQHQILRQVLVPVWESSRQQKYALDLLPRADMLDSRPLATPLTSGTELPKLDVTSLSDPTYFILLLSRLTLTISYTPRTRIKILPLGPPFTFC